MDWNSICNTWDSVYQFLGTDEGGLFSWGLYIRLLGLCFAISLFSFCPQIVGLAGVSGVTPLRPMMTAWKRDYGWKAYWWWPTVFWITGPSDWALQIVPFIGGLCGLGAFLGGPSSSLFVAFAWWILLSMDCGPSVLIYPWDSVLMEIGFLSIWLPTTTTSFTSLLLNSISNTSATTPLFSSSLLLTPSTWATTALPTPLHALAFRVFVFRLLVGFGKLKFTGTSWRDRLYIKNFLLTQPMISPFGYWAFTAMPAFVWIFSLLMMFVVEMVLPITQLLYSGIHRIIAAVSIAALMIGIQMTGNFGYFNILSSVACIPLLHHSSVLSYTLLDLAPADTWAFLSTLWTAVQHDITSFSWTQIPAMLGSLEASGSGSSSSTEILTTCSHVFTAIFLLVLVYPCGLLQFTMNSWVNLGWTFWPGTDRMSFIVRIPIPCPMRMRRKKVVASGTTTSTTSTTTTTTTTTITSTWGWSTGFDVNLLAPVLAYSRFLRYTSQFRLVQAYGVFPPQTSPPQRWACVYEGSNDGIVWKRYEYMYYMSSRKTVPRVIAPYHPRIDHAVFYESLGMNGNNFLCNFGHNLPYAFFVSSTPWQRLQMRLLQGSPDVQGFFRENPFPDTSKPPRFVRIAVCHFTPTTPEQVVKSNGDYWIERPMGLHSPPLSLDTSERDTEHAVEGYEDIFPLSDASPCGPEEFWWESIHWRAHAVQTAGVITKEDYVGVWEFIANVRRISYDIATRELAKTAKEGKVVSAQEEEDENDEDNEEDVTETAKKSSRRRGSSKTPKSTTKKQATTTKKKSSTTEIPVIGSPQGLAPPAVRPYAYVVDDQYIRIPPVLPKQLIDPTTSSSSSSSSTAARKSKTAGRSGATSSGSPITTAADDAMDGSTASILFQWEYASDVVVELRKIYTMTQLVHLRRTLNRMILPILRSCERLCQRLTPTPQTLQDELRTCAEGEISAEVAALYTETMISLMDGSTKSDVHVVDDDANESSKTSYGAKDGRIAPNSTPIKIVSNNNSKSRSGSKTANASAAATAVSSVTLGRTAEGMPIYPFSGNAGADVEGALAGPMKWGMYAHFLCLVGGRKAYERAIGVRPPGSSSTDADADARVVLEEILLNKRLPTGFSSLGANDHSGASPLPVLFRDICCGGNPAPGTMGVEAGTFLLVCLCYDTFSDSAICYHRLMCQSRGDKAAVPGPLPAFLPGFLHLVHRLLAHPNLRRRHVRALENAPPPLQAAARRKCAEEELKQREKAGFLDFQNNSIAREAGVGGILGSGLEVSESGKIAYPFVIESAVPLWIPNEDETDYILTGIYRSAYGTNKYSSVNCKSVKGE